MIPRVPLTRLLLALLGGWAAHRAEAQLAAKSPFMPPAAGSGNAPTAGAPLEFRGFIETGEGIQYRIFDPAKKTGAWVRLNERNPDWDVLVKQHDGAQKTLTIEHQGKTLTLAEREAKVVSSGTIAQAAPPIATVLPSNVPPAVTQAVVLNPTPADEQKRLEAVAAEVQRRRALREQATQQVGQMQPTPLTVPPSVIPPARTGPTPLVQPGGPRGGPGSNQQR